MERSEASLDLISLYLHDIGTVERLSEAEELELGHVIQQGKSVEASIAAGEPLTPELQYQIDEGTDAKWRMVEANLRLVVAEAKRYWRTGVPLLDLAQEGTLKLIGAAEDFDPTRGTKFSTLATPRIQAAMLATLAAREQGNRKLREIEQATENASLLLGEPHPTDEQIAELTRDLTPKQIRKFRWLRAVQKTVSLFYTDEENGNELQDRLADPAAVPTEVEALNNLDSANLRQLMSEILTDKERIVLELRFGLTNGEEVTYERISKQLGMNIRTIFRIERRALNKLRSDKSFKQRFLAQE